MAVVLDYEQAKTVLAPLVVFVLSMTFYSIFIFKFYRFLARKDIIRLDLYKKGHGSGHWMLKSFLAVLYYIVEYIVLLPVFIFFWFAFLALLLTFLAKNQTLDTILLVAIAVVGAVRMTAYYSEDLSKDLAKMLPFALLGVLLVDLSYFNVANSFEIVKQVPEYLDILVYYLGFIVALEFVLRVMDIIFGKKDDEIVKEIRSEL